MVCCKGYKPLGKKTSLICMLTMTGGFFLAEIIVGHITKSTALVADSFHMLSDVLSIVIGYLAVRYSSKQSKINTYGWVRAEVLGALCNAVFLLALCFTIILSGIQRLIRVEEIDQPLLILGVGGAGLVINLIGLFLFHGHAHGHHHHGHDHDHGSNHVHLGEHDDHGEHEHIDIRKDVQTINKAIESKQRHRKSSSSQLNMRAIFLHVLGDALGSVVVIASALTVQFAEGDWRFYVDPAMSLVIAIIIITTTLPLFKKSALILLQNPPDHIKKDELLCQVKQVSGIQAIHELHVWQLSGCCVIASAHVAMHNGDDFNETAMKVIQIFHDKGVHSITLQPEFYNCKEGQSLCGFESCYYNNTNSGSSHIRSDQEESNDACLLSCVSKQCEEFQCCNGLRKRQSCSDAEINQDAGINNPMFQAVSVA